MTKIAVVVTGAMVVMAMLLSECLTVEKHWPDFSCHPANKSPLQQKRVNHYGMGWESCKQSYIKYQGRCDKVCILINREILVRTVKKGPFTINVTTFITRLAEEVGINLDNPSESEKKIISQVRTEAERCKEKYPEHATLPVKDTPCEPWENVTQCIGAATGCGNKTL